MATYSMGSPKFNPLYDIFSGVLLAATSVPQLVAYAEITGYASYRGLSTAGLPLAVWGLVTGSPYMNAGVTAMTALMTKVELQRGGDKGNEEEYVYIVAAYSLWVGLASLAMALLGFGKLATFIPSPVQKGFKWGSSIAVLIAALPNGFFAQGVRELQDRVTASAGMGPFLAAIDKNTFGGLYTVAATLWTLLHPWTWGVAPTTIFLVGTYFIMSGGKKVLPMWLPPGTEVMLVPTIATLYSVYYEYSGGVVGEIPSMDPNSGLQLLGGRLVVPVEFLNLQRLLETQRPLAERFGGWLFLALSACTCSGINFLQIMGICSIFQSEQDIAWSPARELSAQGVSCLMAATVGSAPVSGSLSRSLVSRMTGATSSMACLVTALCWIYLQPYMSVLSSTPKASLSAVIVSAVFLGVVWPKDLIRMGIRSRDGILAWSTGIVVALTSPTLGFAVGLLLYGLSSLLSMSVREGPSRAKDKLS